MNIITKNQIRYEGTLSSIDPYRKVAVLKNVTCYGTESRTTKIAIQNNK